MNPGSRAAPLLNLAIYARHQGISEVEERARRSLAELERLEWPTVLLRPPLDA